MIHRGTYDGTIYHNPVNKFCIISVKTADKEVPQEARSTRRYRDHLIRFVATGYELPRTDAVELELDGEWTKGKYGVQLQVEQWREIVPKTKRGVEGYLASGLIKGIGPATAAQIVSRFGVETLDILQNHPERLLEIKGITESKLPGFYRDDSGHWTMAFYKKTSGILIPAVDLVLRRSTSAVCVNWRILRTASNYGSTWLKTKPA